MYATIYMVMIKSESASPGSQRIQQDELQRILDETFNDAEVQYVKVYTIVN